MRMDHRYAAVVFDLDGVLIDSEPIHLEAAKIVLERHGIFLTPEQAAAQTGITIHVFFDKVVKEWGFPGPKPGEDWVAEKRAVFREMAESELQPVAGADGFLRALRGSANAGASCCAPTTHPMTVRIGLASSSPRRYVDWILKKFDWNSLFDAICTIEDVLRPKPDPQMYRLIVERLSVEERKVLVFEDSPAGIEAAVAAGLDCVGVGTSYSSDSLRSAGAKWFVRDFTDRKVLAALLGDSLASSSKCSRSR